MGKKITKQQLTDLGCLNPDDYKTNITNNLKWKCSCGEEFTRSLNVYKRPSKQCTKCTGTYKPSKEDLSDMGCLNPNDYKNNSTNNLRWTCDCGETFTRALGNYKRKSKKCNKCSLIDKGLKKRISKSDLISLGCLNPEAYQGVKTKLNWKCFTCDNTIEDRDYDTLVHKGLNRCVICTNKISKPEQEIIEYLKSLGITNIKSQQRILIREVQRPLEIDIYLEDLNIGIEFHGMLWHSVFFKYGKDKQIIDKPKMKTLSKEKHFLAKDQNIRLVQIHEIDWNTNKSKIKSFLKHLVGKSSTKRIYARKTTIKEIDRSEAKDFLNKYHIQGASNIQQVNLGLFYEDKLVSVTSFNSSNLTRHKDHHELIRHATSCNVIGALGKATKFYQKNYYNKIMTFCNLDMFDGKSYLKAGFKESYYSEPQYFYVVGNKRYHKRLFQRQKIAKLFPDFEFKTYGETSMVKELIDDGYPLYKIYDSGKDCYVIT